MGQGFGAAIAESMAWGLLLVALVVVLVVLVVVGAFFLGRHCGTPPDPVAVLQSIGGTP